MRRLMSFIIGCIIELLCIFLLLYLYRYIHLFSIFVAMPVSSFLCHRLVKTSFPSALGHIAFHVGYLLLAVAITACILKLSGYNVRPAGETFTSVTSIEDAKTQ